MPPQPWLRLLSLPLLFALSTPPHAEVYKWVDEHGKVHYGDRPGNAQSEQIQIKAAPAQPDPDADEHREKSQKLLNELSDERTEKKQQEAKHQEEEAQRKVNCEQAQKQLADYQTSSYLYDIDKNGQRRVFNDEEYKKAMEQARAEVKKWCSP